MGAVILKSFWETLPGRVIQLATLVAAVATLLAASRGIGRLVWNSVTRDYQITRDLALLSCGVQVDHFQHVLGRPPQFVNRSEEHVEHVFVLRDAYVQTVTDLNNKVLYFSITTRTPRFHPTLEHYAHEVTLGHTTFEQLGYEQPDGVLASLGARRFSYSEAYYFGNPGGYNTFVYSMNDAGYTSGEGLIQKIFLED